MRLIRYLRRLLWALTPVPTLAELRRTRVIRNPVTTPRPGDVLLGPDGIERAVVDCTGTRVEYTTSDSYPYRFNTTLSLWSSVVARGSEIVRLAEGA